MKNCSYCPAKEFSNPEERCENSAKRFRGDIHVSATDGETRLATDWVGKGGPTRKLRDAEVSAARQKVGAVVGVKAAGVKEISRS